jgi:hypothetical protein
VAGVELSWPSRSGRADRGRGGFGAEILAAESMFWGLRLSPFVERQRRSGQDGPSGGVAGGVLGTGRISWRFQWQQLGPVTR